MSFDEIIKACKEDRGLQPGLILDVFINWVEKNQDRIQGMDKDEILFLFENECQPYSG